MMIRTETAQQPERAIYALSKASISGLARTRASGFYGPPSSISRSITSTALLSHAVPLDEYHIAALSHSALALDIYAWLAQRLHRVPATKPAFVSWAALHGQFGQGYTGDQAVKKFRAVFKVALNQVLALYKAAKITEDERQRPSLFIQGGSRIWREPPAKGLTLHNSPPPVSRRLHSIS